MALWIEGREEGESKPGSKGSVVEGALPPGRLLSHLSCGSQNPSPDSGFLIVSNLESVLSKKLSNVWKVSTKFKDVVFTEATFP